MLNVFVVGAGGFLGAVARYLIGLITISETFLFPIKTFLINVIGCILIGLITIAVSKNIPFSPQLVLFMKVGVCGGFTTFSTFALETTALLRDGHIMIAFLYILLSVLAGIFVIFAIEILLAR